MMPLDTITQAKQFLRENWKEGVECPCCTQFVKLYRRKITSSMAYGLILLTQRYNVHEEFHLEEFFKGQYGLPSSIRGDMTKLKYWNLLLPHVGKREDGSNRNGIYSLTKDSFRFVSRETSVPKYALLYNNKLRGFDGENVFINQCLGDKFNYLELMAA